jgi:carboxyl-terminal processing protease
MRPRRWMMLASLLAISALSFAQDLDLEVQRYVNSFFNGLKPEYLHSSDVKWDALQTRALETVRNLPKDEAAQTAIIEALETIGDPAIVFERWLTPAQNARRKDFGELGIRADQETGVVYEVFVAGAAEKVGVHVGDEIISINGQPPKIQGEHVYSSDKIVPLVLKRGDQNLEINVPIFTLPGVIAPMHAGRLGKVAYLEPARENPEGYGKRAALATSVQFSLRSIETSGACGYILDFRRVRSNLMPTISGLGPVLTQTNATLFKVVHPDGSGHAIQYEPRTGNSSWGSTIEGSLASRPWQPQRPKAPIAVLTGPFNDEDVLPVAFVGRANTRFFGEPRAFPPFDYHRLDFSDGAYIAFPAGMVLDRLGHRYDVPLEINEVVPTDWAVFGTKNDAVIQAAQAWLEAQPACK